MIRSILENMALPKQLTSSYLPQAAVLMNEKVRPVISRQGGEMLSCRIVERPATM